MSTCDRLSRRSIHHHITDTLTFWQGLRDGKHIRHIIQMTRGLSVGTTGELQHIDTDGQPPDGQGVFKELIVLTTGILTLNLIDNAIEQRHNLLVALLRIYVGLQVAIGFQAIDGQCQSCNVAQFLQGHLLRLLRSDDAMIKRDLELGIDEFLLCIAQDTHAFPRAPLAESLTDISQFLCLRHI